LPAAPVTATLIDLDMDEPRESSAGNVATRAGGGTAGGDNPADTS
jgi:hypothetical protein